MPSTATITAFYTFTASTKARASQVNANFSNLRGHSLPIDPTAASAANNTYDLGSSEYYWRYAYLGTVLFRSSTSTGAQVALEADTAATTGSLQTKINGSVKFKVDTNGMDMQYANWTNATATVPIAALGALSYTVVGPVTNAVTAAAYTALVAASLTVTRNRPVFVFVTTNNTDGRAFYANSAGSNLSVRLSISGVTTVTPNIYAQVPSAGNTNANNLNTVIYPNTSGSLAISLELKGDGSTAVNADSIGLHMLQ
jgi:hypothetical protein